MEQNQKQSRNRQQKHAWGLQAVPKGDLQFKATPAGPVPTSLGAESPQVCSPTYQAPYETLLEFPEKTVFPA